VLIKKPLKQKSRLLFVNLLINIILIKTVVNDAKFKEINEAYQTLSDKNKRAQYDQFGSGGPQFGGGQQGNPFGGQGGFGGFSGKISCDKLSREVERSLISVISIWETCLDAAFGFGGGRRVRRGRNIEVQMKMTFKESIFVDSHEILMFPIIAMENSLE
jgi:DnaJ-class molecular chaperone